MNVRFFGGRKEEYLSIPKHNPIGLYFCADTRELFLGDRLLSDGLRVVPTFADLPSISEHKAAEGIIYFVEATKNGYVLSSDRTKWIQVIYAPEAGSSVKAISFAGIEMEEVDGVFTIDRRCAREALGFIVPDGMEDEELEIATKDYVDSQIAAISGADLSEYAKKSELEAIEAKIPSIEGLASEEFVLKKIDDKVESVNTVVNNITEQVTQVTEQVSNIENNYVTNETLETNYVTNTILQENYVSNTVLEEKNFVTNTVLEENYVTNTEVNELVANEVNNVVTEQIETKVETIIQEKVDSGEIEVKVDSISYGDFEDDLI